MVSHLPAHRPQAIVARIPLLLGLDRSFEIVGTIAVLEEMLPSASGKRIRWIQKARRMDRTNLASATVFMA